MVRATHNIQPGEEIAHCYGEYRLICGHAYLHRCTVRMKIRAFTIV